MAALTFLGPESWAHRLLILSEAFIQPGPVLELKGMQGFLLGPVTKGVAAWSGVHETASKGPRVCLAWVILSSPCESEHPSWKARRVLTRGK